jgi:hypothetical protein
MNKPTSSKSTAPNKYLDAFFIFSPLKNTRAKLRKKPTGSNYVSAKVKVYSLFCNCYYLLKMDDQSVNNMHK